MDGLTLYHIYFFFHRSIECEEAVECQDEDAVNPEDLPVQGPLPQDPEDAPWKKNESGGVRRL